MQLPTFEIFTISTTVVVPDSGTASLGGVSRSSQQRASRGVPGLSGLPAAGRLFGNRGIGSATSRSGAAVSAQIIDHDELDRAILGEGDGLGGGGGGIDGAGRFDGEAGRLASKADFISRNVARGSLDREPVEPRARKKTVEEIRHDNLVAAERRRGEAESLYQKATSAEERGLPGAARQYYLAASKRADGELRAEIQSRLTALQDTIAAKQRTKATSDEARPAQRRRAAAEQAEDGEEESALAESRGSDRLSNEKASSKSARSTGAKRS